MGPLGKKPMSNENEAGENLETVSDAIERVDDDDLDTLRPEAPAKKGGLKAWMKQSASLMTHIVALLAAFAAFGKSCDHSVTKNAYDALSANITKLSENQEKLGQDVANMHGYLEGLSHQPIPAWGVFDSGVVVTIPSPPTADQTHPKATSTKATITFLVDDGGVPLTPAAPAQAVLPPASPVPPPVKPSSFAAVEAK